MAEGVDLGRVAHAAALAMAKPLGVSDFLPPDEALWDKVAEAVKHVVLAEQKPAASPLPRGVGYVVLYHDGQAMQVLGTLFPSHEHALTALGERVLAGDANRPCYVFAVSTGAVR